MPSSNSSSTGSIPKTTCKTCRSKFSLPAAHFYGELDAVYPFREGNSRTLRLFFYGVVQKAGYLLDWAALGVTEDTESARQRLYRARDLTVMRADSSALTKIFVSILSAL